MLKSYRKDIVALATIFGFLGYAVYVCAAPQKEVLTATRGDKVEAPAKAAPAPAPKEVKKPAGKEVKKTVTSKEVVVTPDPKKDPNRKKPTLKAKYADKK